MSNPPALGTCSLLAVAIGVGLVFGVPDHAAGSAHASPATGSPAQLGARTLRSRLVFTEWNNIKPRLYTINPDGTGLKEIPTSSDAAWPALSPDGRRIAFQGGVAEGPIEVMNVDGRARHVVAPRGTAPAWSRDGTRIAYSVRGKGIYVVAPDGRGRHYVVGSPSQASVLATWSPDGRIVYVCDARSFGICLISPDGANRRLLIRTSGFPVGLVYSPGGTRIAYQTHGRLYVMNANGTHLHRLPPLIHYKNQDCNLAWSPDGKQIAFSPIERGGIYLIQLSRNKLTRLRGTDHDACGVAWQRSPAP